MTLYILGNGFDLNNGLETSLGNFRKYVQLHHPEKYRKFSWLKSGDDWRNLENDMQKSYNLIKDKITKDYKRFLQNHEHNIIGNELIRGTEITNLLKEWLLRIEIPNDMKKLTNKHIINFNYTNYMTDNPEGFSTYMKTFNIHGSLDSGMSIQFGHTANKIIKLHNPNTTLASTIEMTTEHIYNEYQKQLNFSIKQLSRYLRNKSFSRLVFMGFSFSEQDEIYMSNIKKSLLEDSEVIFYYHNKDKELNKKKSRIRKYFENVRYIDSDEWSNDFLVN